MASRQAASGIEGGAVSKIPHITETVYTFENERHGRRWDAGNTVSVNIIILEWRARSHISRKGN
jgi:hypothetical protein